MAKITAKASLVQNSNLFLHIADKGATDISITDVDGTDFTIDSVALADFATTGAADADGVINRAIAVGDVVTLSHMATAGNEGLEGTVTAVTDEQVAVTKTSAHTITSETAGSDINVIAFTKTYQFVEAGDMDFVDGCQGIVLASKLVDMWDTLDLDKYERPFTSIEPRAKSLASLNGWEPHDTNTINAIRDTALEIRNSATSVAHQIYALWRSGDLNAAADQFKFWTSSQTELGEPTQAVMAGYVNQLFLIYDASGSDNRNSNHVVDSTLTGTIDATASTAVVGVGTLFTTELVVGDYILVTGERRQVTVITDNLNLTVDVAFTDTANDTAPKKVIPITWFTRCAEVGKTIVMEEHEVTYAEIMPVSAANAVDPKLVATDVEIATALSKWEDIDITDDTLVYSGDVDGTPHDFDRWLEGDSQTNQTVHEKINYLLRQTGNINQSADFSLRGDKQWPITTFSGEVFTVQGYLVNYDASQRNDLRVVDVAPTTWNWPSVMTITVTAPDLAVGGTFTIYHTNTYGTDGAVVFQNEGDVPQQDIAITSSWDIVMAFSTYAVDGHTGGNDLPVTLAYNRPGAIEPDVVEAILAGSNLTIAISPTADPSYIA